MSDGFVTVTAKGRRRPRKHVQAPITADVDVPIGPKDLEAFANRLGHAMDVLQSAPFVWEAIHYTTELKITPTRFVSLGLGNFITTRASEGQLAAFLLYREAFRKQFRSHSEFRDAVKGMIVSDSESLEQGRDFVFDPAFTAAERDILNRLGFTVTKHDPWGEVHIVKEVAKELESKQIGVDSDWSLFEGGVALFAPHTPIELVSNVFRDSLAFEPSKCPLLICNSPAHWLESLRPKDLRLLQSSVSACADYQAPELAKLLYHPTDRHLIEVLLPCTFSDSSRFLHNADHLSPPPPPPKSVLSPSVLNRHEQEYLLLSLSSTSILHLKH